MSEGQDALLVEDELEVLETALKTASPAVRRRHSGKGNILDPMRDTQRAYDTSYSECNPLGVHNRIEKRQALSSLCARRRQHIGQTARGGVALTEYSLNEILII